MNMDFIAVMDKALNDDLAAQKCFDAGNQPDGQRHRDLAVAGYKKFYDMVIALPKDKLSPEDREHFDLWLETARENLARTVEGRNVLMDIAQDELNKSAGGIKEATEMVNDTVEAVADVHIENNRQQDLSFMKDSYTGEELYKPISPSNQVVRLPDGYLAEVQTDDVWIDSGKGSR